VDYEVRICCYEIHIETVRDLIDVKNEVAQLMTKGWDWKPTFLRVRSAQEVDDVLRQAYKNRTTGATNLNLTSSRSHCIY
jgi:hypothetical protein